MNMLLKSEIKRQAIRHYQRMIKFALSQKWFDEAISLFMLKEIGECWSGEYCAYCNHYFTEDNIESDTECIDCPLNPGSDSENCCDDLYEKMADSKYWITFAYRAWRVLRYIQRNG